MKIAFFLLSFLSVFSALAAPLTSKTVLREERARFEIYPLNYQSRFERDESQGIQSRNALNLAVGGSKGLWGLLFEYSRFNAVSGTDYASLQRQHEESLLWLRREGRLSRHFLLSLSGGLGFSRETVETRFGNEAVTDQGRAEPLAAAAVGTAFEMKKTLRLSLEGRLFFGAGFDPNPQPDLVFRSGFRF